MPFDKVPRSRPLSQASNRWSVPLFGAQSTTQGPTWPCRGLFGPFSVSRASRLRCHSRAQPPIRLQNSFCSLCVWSTTTIDIRFRIKLWSQFVNVVFRGEPNGRSSVLRVHRGIEWDCVHPSVSSSGEWSAKKKRWGRFYFFSESRLFATAVKSRSIFITLKLNYVRVACGIPPRGVA